MVGRKIIYLELVVPVLNDAGSRGRALGWFQRDFPWAFGDGWIPEWWGVRVRDHRDATWQGMRVRGPRLPFERVPWIVLVAAAWTTHLILALRHPRVGILMARHPYLAGGAALARRIRRSRPLLMVGIIERAASKALNVYGSRLVSGALDLVDRFVLRRADVVILMGDFTRELARRAGVGDEKIIRLPHPPRWGSDEALRATDDGARLVVCAARQIPGKGLDVLIRAFAEVVREFPDALLDIAGDGPERPSLEGLVGRLGLGHNVRFRGWVGSRDMAAFFGGAPIAVLPSRVQEGHPMALQEAALSGCALVGTDLGGVRDIVVPGRTGLLVPSEDPNGLARAICDLLADPDEARRLGDAAREDSIAYYGGRNAAVEDLRNRLAALVEQP
ncbi:MAG: glycosyltransferase [Actinomycetota bacterium]